VTESLEEALGAHRFLAGLPEGTTTLVAGCVRRVNFETGELLLSEGAPADTLHLVEQGRVAIEIHRPAQGSLVIETVESGHVVGLSWVSPPFRWHFDARALEPVTTLAIDSECLRTQLGQNPVIGYALLERLSSMLLERLQATRVRLLDLYGLGDDHPH
jgi:CRP/FNR family cyclic AMP-dependent transcriptional regulator